MSSPVGILETISFPWLDMETTYVKSYVINSVPYVNQFNIRAQCTAKTRLGSFAHRNRLAFNGI